MKEEIEDDLKKLNAEMIRLSVDKELEAYEKILASDIQQLETLYGNLDNWDKAFTLAKNIKFLNWPISRKITNPEKEAAKEERVLIKKRIKYLLQILKMQIKI